ncbi:probable beta-1,4-xylosyltransferase IRX9H, partial [Tanacetum coccineum]
NVERSQNPEFKKSEIMKRKVNNDMRRQHLSAKTQVGLRSQLDGMVHYTELRMLGHQSHLVRQMVNDFVIGTVVDVPFAQDTIKDVIEFIFFHHYVHPVNDEVYFDSEFARKRQDLIDKFDLACAGVHLGIDKLMHVFVINIVITYRVHFTFEEFRDYMGFWGGNLTDDEDVVGWGESTTIQAERLLLRAALENPVNRHFVLLSDSIVGVRMVCLISKAVPSKVYFDLSREKEPDIFNAIKFGTVMENVVFDEHPREVDYSDKSVTGVPSEILDPTNSWADKGAHKETLTKLGGLFKKNFEVFLDYKIGTDNNPTDEILAAAGVALGQLQWLHKAKTRQLCKETTFIEQLVEDESQMEASPSGCSKIMNWHLHLEAHGLAYPRGWLLQMNLDAVLPIE